MDKVQKIREEVRKIAKSINPYIPDDEGKNSEYEAGRFAMVTQIIQIIDSMQEEPVSDVLEETAEEWDESLYRSDAFKAGAKWQKANLWKPADGDDLPEIDREVIVLTQPYPNDEHLRVVFAHRPNKYTKVWNSDLGEEQVVEIERYGKGEWNIPDVKYWLDCLMPKEIEL